MRPLLEDQITLSKMSDEEIIQLLLPHGFWQWVDFRLNWHFSFLWRVLHWNWFDIWDGTENADKYRSWDIKIKRMLFGGNKSN